MKKWLSAFIIFQLLTLNLSFAQEDNAGGDDIIKNTQNDIMLVGAAGAGGAILGLSTLSFYDKASNHIANVWTGAAIGIIVGVIFVAYNSAQKGQEELVGSHSSEEFSTSERSSWHTSESQVLTMSSVQFGTQFWQTSF